MEYPGRIQQEHVEEVKQDHFHEGLSPEYQWMLAHKVDGENLVTYSKLLLAAWNRGRIRPKTQWEEGGWVLCWGRFGNIKGGWYCGRVIRLYCVVCQCSRAISEKEMQLLWVWQPRSPGEGLTKGIGENCKEGRFKLERGDSEEGRLVLSKVGGYPRGHPRWRSQSIKTSKKAPFLNPDSLTNWSGAENTAWVKINDEGSWALLESGSTINTVTLEFIQACSLEVGPLSDLVDGTVGLCHH